MSSVCESIFLLLLIMDFLLGCKKCPGRFAKKNRNHGRNYHPRLKDCDQCERKNMLPIVYDSHKFRYSQFCS